MLEQHTKHGAGRPRPLAHALAQSDSIEGIYDTLKECACISKSAGGIGLSIHNIRAVGSYIRGTNGNSNGIVPMLRVFNDTARCRPLLACTVFIASGSKSFTMTAVCIAACVGMRPALHPHGTQDGAVPIHRATVAVLLQSISHKTPFSK